MKTCPTCKQEKSEDQFGIDKHRKSGMSPRCKPCNVEMSAAWAKKNKEKRRLISEKYRLANMEKCKDAVKKSQQKNQERILKWVEENKEKTKEYKKRWQDKNKEYGRSQKAKRRGAHGVYTTAQIKRLKELQQGRCACCSKELNNDFHRDHIIAVAKGGTNSISNIQLLCPRCNRSKGAKDPISFMQTRGFLL